MKKYLILVIVVASLLVLPSSMIRAQGVEPIDIPATGGDSETTTTEESPKVPGTGIAPSGKFVQNIAVFTGGSLIGIGIGFGIITIRKQFVSQEAEIDDFSDE